MNATLRNILAVIAGIVIGSVVNMLLINAGGYVVLPPEGTDVTTEEGLRAALPLFGPQHYIFPFLAHALGTLVGAFVAAKIAAANKRRFALTIGIFFLFGGFYMVFLMPSPIWFTLLDLIVAYIPMALLGEKLAESRK